jgi:hypothetical protein
LETPLTLYVEDRLPLSISINALEEAIAKFPNNGSSFRRVADRPICCNPKRTLRNTLLDDHLSVQQQVIFYVWQRCQYANIFFNFINEPHVEIRIAFTNVVLSSFVNIEDLKELHHHPTMKLAFSLSSTKAVFPHVALHDFGHVLSMIDE